MASGGAPNVGATYTSRARGLAVSTGNWCIRESPSARGTGRLLEAGTPHRLGFGQVVCLEAERGPTATDDPHAQGSIELQAHGITRRIRLHRSLLPGPETPVQRCASRRAQA